MCSLKVESLGFPNDQAEINPRTGELWFFDGPALYRLEGDTVENVYVFDCDQPGRLIHFNGQGWILAGLERTGKVHLSKDGGLTFEVVLEFDNPTSFSLNWAVEAWGLELLLGEYNLDRKRTANIYRSFDGGRNWDLLHRFSANEHIHLIRRDPHTGLLYVSAGDKLKNVYVTDDLRTFRRVKRQNSGLMSIGCSPQAVYFGTDKRSGNFIIRDGRKGESVQWDLVPPLDLMVYDFAWIDGRMLCACRLTHNLAENKRNSPCILAADSLDVLSRTEAFYFTKVIDGVLYTARTNETLRIASG